MFARTFVAANHALDVLLLAPICQARRLLAHTAQSIAQAGLLASSLGLS